MRTVMPIGYDVSLPSESRQVIRTINGQAILEAEVALVVPPGNIPDGDAVFSSWWKVLRALGYFLKIGGFFMQVNT